MIIQPIKTVKIFSVANPALKINAGLCNTFRTRLMGFMFQRNPETSYGLLFPGKNASKIDASIHMFFVSFNLAVFWLDYNNTVVDKVLAKKWHPLYIPREIACHILELHEDRYNDISIGDLLEIRYGE